MKPALILTIFCLLNKINYLTASEPEPSNEETVGSEHDITESEPAYNPKDSKKASNCYTYAIQDYDWYLSPKTPGGYDAVDGCEALKNGLISDAKTKARAIDCPSLKGSNKATCKKEEYLIMMFQGNLGSTFGYDFHFYRQDSNGFFSHQLGDATPTNLVGGFCIFVRREVSLMSLRKQLREGDEKHRSSEE